MDRVLVVPSSDYIGHPFPQRLNHIFERINTRGSFEVHVLRFNLFGKTQLHSDAVVHEPRDLKLRPLPLYYLANMMLHASAIRRIVRDERIDVVLLSNLSPCFAYKILQDAAIPCLFDLPDFFPVSAAGYVIASSSVAGKVVSFGLESMLRIILEGCRRTTVASSALLSYVRHLGVRDAVYLPNGVGDEFLTVANGEDVRERFRVSKGEILFAYVGSLAFWINMTPVLDALAMARRRGMKVRFMVVGGNLHNDYVSMLRGMVTQRGLDDIVFFTGFVPYQDVPRYIAAADLCILPHDVHNPTGYYAGPNKIWEYLSQKKPVLAHPIAEALTYSDVLEIVSDAESYLHVLESFCRGPEPFQEKAAKGREIAMKMTWDSSAKMMEASLRDVIDSPTSGMS